jgi:hypothetical protein
MLKPIYKDFLKFVDENNCSIIYVFFYIVVSYLVYTTTEIMII